MGIIFALYTGVYRWCTCILSVYLGRSTSIYCCFFFTWIFVYSLPLYTAVCRCFLSACRCIYLPLYTAVCRCFFYLHRWIYIYLYILLFVFFTCTFVYIYTSIYCCFCSSTCCTSSLISAMAALCLGIRSDTSLLNSDILPNASFTLPKVCSCLLMFSWNWQARLTKECNKQMYMYFDIYRGNIIIVEWINFKVVMSTVKVVKRLYCKCIISYIVCTIFERKWFFSKLAWIWIIIFLNVPIFYKYIHDI